jgi:hypothetical protein
MKGLRFAVGGSTGFMAVPVPPCDIARWYAATAGNCEP